MKAALVETEKAAFTTQEAPCAHFGICGGCTLQDLAYADQVTLKRERVQRAFASLAWRAPIELVPLDDPWRYRNKAELTFSRADGQLTLGYHAARSYWRVIDLDECWLLPRPMVRVMGTVRRLARETGLAPYDAKRHEGFFRYLTLRASRATGQMQICVITAPGSREAIQRLAEDLRRSEPMIRSVYWGIARSVADIAQPEELTCMAGAPYVEEQIGTWRVMLHPLTFVQPNLEQAERIYGHIAQLAQTRGGSVAWDVYCGMGLIGFSLAPAFQLVYGLDSSAQNLELAARNAHLNDVTNMRFRCGKVEDLLRDRRFALRDAKPELVMVDPPRAGLHPGALDGILAARPRQILYLSCNIRTLVRDAALLQSSYPRYRLMSCRAFDMFPQTNHVEVLVQLVRV